MAGIRVLGGSNNLLEGNLVEGYADDGILIENSPGTVARDNVVRAEQLYGPIFQDVVDAVSKNGNAAEHHALSAILKNSDEQAVIASWVTIGKRFGVQIGRFSLAVLANILAPQIYVAIKAALAAHGITLP
jgi:parallel beta-helix repeat protein